MTSSQNILLSLLSLSILAYAFPATAGNNTTDIEQDKGYKARISQDGTFNEAIIRQIRFSEGKPDGVNTLSLAQNGNRNIADIEQRAPVSGNGHVLNVQQTGDDNRVTYSASLFSSSGSEQLIRQSGNNNDANVNAESNGVTIIQEGNNHQAQAFINSGAVTIEQVGALTSNNQALAIVASGGVIRQEASNTTAIMENLVFAAQSEIRQLVGSDGSYADITSRIGSGEQDADRITQSGADNVAIIDGGASSSAEITQSANNGNARIIQIVSNNDAMIEQRGGNFNDGVIVQGGGNNASLLQDGSFNRAFIEQGNFAGDDVNTANINQFGDANSASVRQLSPNNIVNATQNGGSSLFVVQN